MIFMSNFRKSMWLKGRHFGINRRYLMPHISTSWVMNSWGSSNFISYKKINSCNWKRGDGWGYSWR